MATVEWIITPEPRPSQKQRRPRCAPLLIFRWLKMWLYGLYRFLLLTISTFCCVNLKQIFSVIVLVKRKVMVLVPLASRWKNSMPSNQIEANSLGCWVDFKRFALTCHNMNHDWGVCHTHSIVVNVTTPQLFPLAPHSYSLSLSFCLSDNCIIWPYRRIWNTAEKHLLAEPNRYANLFHSQRFDKLDCSLWKASFKHMAAASNPIPFFLSFFFPTSPSSSLPPLFHHFLHSISLPVCFNLWSFAS